MKKFFNSLSFNAKYDESNEMWLIYNNNLLVAKLYDDSGCIKFVDKDVSFDRDELRELIKLSSEIQNQYTQLND